MKYFVKLSYVFFFCFTFISFPQKNVADSLIKQLDKLTGEKKVDALNHVAEIYNIYEIKVTYEYASQGLSLAQSLNYQKGIAKSYWILGYYYVNIDNQKALEYSLKALELSRKIKENVIIGNSLSALGVIYYYTGDYYNSIEYNLNAIKAREEIGDQDKIAASLNNMSLVHMAIGNYEIARNYLLRAYDIRVQLNDHHGKGIVLNNIGEVYAKLGKYDEAYQYYNRALKLYRETADSKLTANALYNLATVYQVHKDTANALKYYYESLGIFTTLNRKNGIANVENGLASLYNEYGLSQFAISHALNALKNAMDIHSLGNISTAANILKDEYIKAGDYQKAYHFLSIYVNAKDSLFSVEKVKKLNKMEYDYRIEQLKKEQDAKLEKQNLFIYALSITIVLLVVIFILIYLSYWQKKKSNKQLNKLNEQLGEINSTKDKFFSIIAHDLKSPFFGLMGYSQILSEEYDELKEDEKKAYIGNLYDLTKSSFRLLENLLEWSRLQTGKMDYNPANYNVHNVLFPTLDLLAKTALNKRISMDIQIDEELEVKADKYMLQAVVRNLISNSIKFTQPNGNIIVRAKDTKESIVITVEDDGVGMSRDVVGSLFKIEKNISTKGTANEQGTGLGLLLCKEMVELHNGKIWVESKEGEGSKFFISLP